MYYAQCCHGDGSGVRHVHIKYHGHLLYYQATVLVYCLTFIVAMATVVMEDTCVQNIMAICSIIRLLCW